MDNCEHADQDRDNTDEPSSKQQCIYFHMEPEHCKHGESQDDVFLEYDDGGHRECEGVPPEGSKCNGSETANLDGNQYTISNDSDDCKKDGENIGDHKDCKSVDPDSVPQINSVNDDASSNDLPRESPGNKPRTDADTTIGIDAGNALQTDYEYSDKASGSDRLQHVCKDGPQDACNGGEQQQGITQQCNEQIKLFGSAWQIIEQHWLTHLRMTTSVSMSCRCHDLATTYLRCSKLQENDREGNAR